MVEKDCLYVLFLPLFDSDIRKERPSLDKANKTYLLTRGVIFKKRKKPFFNSKKAPVKTNDTGAFYIILEVK